MKCLSKYGYAIPEAFYGFNNILLIRKRIHIKIDIIYYLFNSVGVIP